MNTLNDFLNASGWEALGQSVIHFLWQGAVIGLLAAIALRGLRSCSAELRYFVSGLFLFTMAAVFVGTFIVLLPEEEVVMAISSTSVGFEGGAAMEGPLVEVVVEAPSVSAEFDYFKIPAACWVLGVFGMLVRFGTAWVRTGHLRRKEISLPEDHWLQAFETLKEQLGVNQAVGLIRSNIAETAMVVGWLKPIVIVPASAFSALTPEQLRAVLAHELAHIRRYDHWVNLLQGLVEILIFFHPATWWLSRQMRVDRENCCDDQAVRVTGSPKPLAEALLRLESFRAAFVTASLAANGGSFKHRILRILRSKPTIKHNQPSRNMMMKKTAGAVGAAVILIGGVSLMNGDEKETSKKNGVKDERIQRVQDDILKALQNGEISREEAALKLNRLRKVVGADKSWKKDKESSKTKEDFEGIEKRLRAAVESGELSEEEAKSKMMAIKKKMAGDKEGEGASKKAMTEEKMRGMAKRIRDAVERGELSKEDAEKKMMELRKMMAGEKEGGAKAKLEEFQKGWEDRDEADEKEGGIYGSFKRMGIDEKRVGRLKGALLEAGIKGERVEGSLGMILRMASQMKAKGDSYKMNDRILGYLKDDLELSMAQIGLIKGLAARLAKGMEKD
ncbi:MAG: M56 family metallopeptidase [Akkermansiaceae bacterium]